MDNLHGPNLSKTGADAILRAALFLAQQRGFDDAQTIAFVRGILNMGFAKQIE